MGGGVSDIVGTVVVDDSDASECFTCCSCVTAVELSDFLIGVRNSQS